MKALLKIQAEIEFDYSIADDDEQREDTITDLIDAVESLGWNVTMDFCDETTTRETTKH